MILDECTANGASYADCRIVSRKRESLSIKIDQPDLFSFDESDGIGIRVIADGAWGFVSISVLDEEELKRVAKLVVSIAKTSAIAKKKGIVLAHAEPVCANWKS